MFWTILDILLGTSFKKAGIGRQYKVAKKGAQYIYKNSKAPRGRSHSNSSKPITENQILEFKKLQKRVGKLENLKISNTQFDVYQRLGEKRTKERFILLLLLKNLKI